MPHVNLGQLVVGHVDTRITTRLDVREQFHALFLSTIELDADKDVSVARFDVAVIELRDLVIADGFTERLEAPRTLWNRGSKNHFAVFAEFGPLRDVTQPVEVDVRTADDRDECLVCDTPGFAKFLDARNRQRASGLGHRARILEDVENRRADLVRIDADHLVHPISRDAKRLFAHLPNRGTIREDADAIEDGALAVSQCGVQAGGVRGFDADDRGLGSHRLHVRRDSCNQAAAAHRNEDRADRLGVLAQDLDAHGALARDHVEIVVGVDVDETLFFGLASSQLVRFVVAVAVQNDLCAKRLDGFDFDRGRRHRHHDARANSALPRRERDPLGVIARRGRDHAARRALRWQQRDLVVRAAQLEGEDRLEVFSLEPDLVAEPSGETRRAFERGLARHVVDARIEDLIDE
jgi:hypothetical protein